MRAISIRQPWMWAILTGLKPVENRSQNIMGGHRGRVLLHVGKNIADGTAFARVEEITGSRVPVLGGPGARTELHAESALVGSVDVIGVHPATACGGACSPWAEYTGLHIRLADPVILRRPVPCPGRLGLFTPSAEVLAAVGRQLR